MNYQVGSKRMNAYREEISEIRKKMRTALAETEPQEVEDYVFTNGAGEVRLSDLFGDKDDLIIVHNMGKSCPACTMWADGYNGVHHHITQRSAFALTSVDAPDVQKEFAASRGWKFPMVSHQGNTFAADMGYRSPEGKWWPGLSTFKRKDGKIYRVADTHLGPHDDFCSVYHLFDMLPAGVSDFRPKFDYR